MASSKKPKIPATYRRQISAKRKIDLIKHYAIQKALLEGHSKEKIKRMFNVNDRNLLMAQMKLDSRSLKVNKFAKNKGKKVKLNQTMEGLSSEDMLRKLEKNGLVKGVTKDGIVVPTKECVRIIDERLNILNQKLFNLRKNSLDTTDSGVRFNLEQEIKEIKNEVSSISLIIQARLSKENLSSFYAALSKLV